MSKIKYLTQKEANDVDVALMSNDHGFSIDQLMELAGLSVAEAVFTSFPRSKYPRVLIVAGPGNNGGDGLVAARHLRHFGYSPTILYPKRTENKLYQNLVVQCKKLNLEFLHLLPDDFEKKYDQILDAIFGFSFKGNIRSPFDVIIKSLSDSKLPIVSVDIPSGWDVEKGHQQGALREPEVLISLTAPKLGVQFYSKRHFLGGRFVPIDMARELNLPEYEGMSQILELK